MTAPLRASKALVEGFVLEHTEWIALQIKRLEKLPPVPTAKDNRADYLKYKEQARELVKRRLEYFNQFYGFKYKQIAIKNQKTRWGSCSRQGNLNFNYKIALLPAEQADYIVVHELCHLGQLNHSEKFWTLVEKTVPDHLRIRSELRKKSINLG